jgi:hypothetical protein
MYIVNLVSSISTVVHFSNSDMTTLDIQTSNLALNRVFELISHNWSEVLLEESQVDLLINW